MKNRIDLANYFNRLGFKSGAEIGVADGRFSEKLCQANPDLRLYCIDPWDTYKGNNRGGGEDQQHGNYEIAQERLSRYNTFLYRDTSRDAVTHFEDGSLDFVFIDGNHDFDYVMMDLILWAPKVRKGGIISGHDYYHFKGSGVIEAVNAYADFHKIGVSVIGENRKHNRDDDQPCFWWVKR